MNSTVIRKKTELPAFAFVADATTLRTLVAFALMTVIWVSFGPFPGGSDLSGIKETGNIVNQLGYSAMFAAAFGTLATLVDRRMALTFIGPGWLLLFGLLVVSAFTAADTASAKRAVAFGLIATTMTASIVAIAPSAGGFSKALLGACAIVLGLSYAGLVLLPDAAIHQATGAEALHAGSWRGLYSHKNIAGPVMAAIAFSGLYLMRRGWRLAGAIITLAALVFVWNTGSKTSAALVPVIIAMVMIPSAAGLRIVSALAVFAAVVTIHAMTIGTVFVPFLDAILRAIDPETTFTGRTEIWRFAGDFVTMHPLTGFGFDSFWQTPVTANADQPFDADWDPRGIIHGHNGFLDVTLFMGFPALFLSIWLFVVAPVLQYLRTPPYRENVLLADLFLMIVAFMTMNAALESFFLRRDDPVWLTLVMALFGLRIVSRWRISPA